MSTGSRLGIDLGGTTIKWERISRSGETQASGRIPTPPAGHEAVAEAIARIIDAAGGTSGLTGVGIAVPGHLSAERDAITLLPNVPGDWLGFPFATWLLERTGISPTLLNDARAFAIAELTSGAARGCSDVVFVTIGTGVGGAFAIDGSVIRSGRDTAGEIGHLTAVADGEPCTCGHRGCVEAYAGGAQILRRAERHGIAVGTGPGALSRFAASAAVSEDAARILSDAFDALAVGVASTCAFLGAQVVVIGGGAADELPGFLERSRRRLAGYTGLLGAVEVRGSSVGIRAGAVGAALAARAQDSIENRIAERIA